MAIPRLNHTQLPNEFIDRYMHQVSPAATKVFLAICRKTIGWHKTTDEISTSQLIEMTGLSRNTVKSAVEELIKIGLIIIYTKGYGKGQETHYTINFEKQAPKSTKIYPSNSDTKTKKTEIYPSKIDDKNDVYSSKIDTKTPVYSSNFDPTKEIEINNINKGIEGLRNLLSHLKVDLENCGPNVNRSLKALSAGLQKAPGTEIHVRGNDIIVTALAVDFRILIDSLRLNGRYRIIETEATPCQKNGKG